MSTRADIHATVHRCSSAYFTALAEESAKEPRKRDLFRPDHEFRRHIPCISDAVSICAFIACITRGMAIGAISYRDGITFLYAAQTASAALPREPRTPRPVGRPRKETTPTPSPTRSADTPDGAPGSESPRTGLRPWGGDLSHLETGERSSHLNLTPTTTTVNQKRQ